MVDAAQVQFAAERLESGAVDAGQAITRFARALELAPRIMRSDLKGANLQDLADALGQTYRKARKAMREAYRTGEIERFHDWRKLAKHHAMQVRITHPLFPYLEMRVQPAAELGELLGRLQDVSVVVEGLRTANGADRRSKTRLCTALDVETERLIEAARAPGQALFGAPRRTFERRLLADLD
jgi:Sec-independent protein translocase protein TatA